ncbi:MAG: ATP-dependent nuclease [Thermodesulfobacteriota bacterium]
MFLKKIQIENYRSIDNLTVDVNENCLIFLGINESGKSNILKALSAISSNFEYDFSEDSKIPISDENYTFKEPKISYFFELTEPEKKQILEDNFGESYQSWPFIYEQKYSKSLNEFINKIIGQLIYKITIKEDNTLSSHVTYSVHGFYFNLKTGKYTTKANVDIKFGETTKNFIEGSIIDAEQENLVNSELLKKYFDVLTKDKIQTILGHNAAKYLRNNLPEVVYWEYDKKYLLVDSVDIASFKTDPDSCLPLKNIFLLAGIDNIEERITHDYKNDSAFHNLKRVLSKAATTHLNTVWKDYKDIKIELNERNGRLSVQVLDTKNLFNFNQRSDGFKRFISFLFILSAQYHSGELKENTIIVFDEPDISLHPSGTRHLLDEIIKLSNKTYCFIASHSIFFIDRANIDRHVIVKKENESTLIKPATYQNFTEEEVLYGALGFSIYDILKPDCFCFEGWTDKEIYKILGELFKNDIPGLPELTNRFGILWSGSANKICQTIKPLFSDDKRRFIAIADFDGPGNKEKCIFSKEFSKTRSFFLTYKDLSNRKLDDLTLEDLLPLNLMLSFFNEYLEEILEKTPNPKFRRKDIDKSGLLNSWKTFCNKEYRASNNKLIDGYKNKIPSYISKYIEDNSDNIQDIKKQFSVYKTFLEKLIAMAT